MITEGLKLGLLAVLASSVVLYILKPKIMFNENKFKPFGTGKDETIIPFFLAITMIGVLFYLLAPLFF